YLLSTPPSSLSPLCSPPSSTLFPYTTLFRSIYNKVERRVGGSGLWLRIKRFYMNAPRGVQWTMERGYSANVFLRHAVTLRNPLRSEEHTSELQSRVDLVCRLLLEKKKIHKQL